jgi:GTP-binding protein
MLNALTGEGRAIVDPVPGTTRDPVDSHLFTAAGRELRVVDTAGMRREVKVKDPIEYFSLLRSRQTLQRVDAAIVIVDASEGVTGPDQRIAQEVVKAGRACVIVLNKWDLVTDDPADRRRLERDIDDKLRFLPWAPMLRTSAVTTRGVERVLPALETAIESHRRRMPTAHVNRIVRSAQERRPHARTAGRDVKVLYAVQAGVAPPTVVLFANARLEDAYLRYIENRIRAGDPLPGSPLRLEVRRKARG